MADKQQFCTFQLAGNWYGLEVTRVQEVLPPQGLTAVPLAHPSVAGLINLRGQIVTAIDLRRRLDLPEREPDARWINVVIETESGAVSLIADDVGEVLSLEPVDFERPPETVPASVRELIAGVYKLADRLLVVLEPQRLVDLS